MAGIRIIQMTIIQEIQEKRRKEFDEKFGILTKDMADFQDQTIKETVEAVREKIKKIEYIRLKPNLKTGFPKGKYIRRIDILEELK